MSTSREQLFNQAPLVSLHLLKIIADDFKAQGKVGESPDCFRELFHRIRRCPLAFPECVMAPGPDFVCMRFLVFALQHIQPLHSQELSSATATSVPAGDSMAFC